MVLNRDLTPLFTLHPPTKLSERLRCYLMRKVNFLLCGDIYMEINGFPLNTALLMKTDHVGFMHCYSKVWGR